MKTGQPSFLQFLLKAILTVIVSFVLIFLCITDSGCKKNEPTPPATVDTIPTPPPAPIDTITYVKRLEVYYLAGVTNNTSRVCDYTFYYDAAKRVTAVGIKNYGNVLFDSATSYVTYAGSSTKPGRIITPNALESTYGLPLRYDTTYFNYNASNQLTSDSAYDYIRDMVTNTVTKRPLKRYYSTNGAGRTFIDWLGPHQPNLLVETLRRDTIDQLGNQQLTNIKTQYYYGTNARANYAITKDFTYTNYVNPLSKLTISGFPYSIIYTPVKNEILGNKYHKAVYNSNILPFYLDFISPKIPSYFALGGYNNSGFLFPPGYDLFDIVVSPLAARMTYPSQITVSGSSSYFGDRCIYKYVYY